MVLYKQRVSEKQIYIRTEFETGDTHVFKEKMSWDLKKIYWTYNFLRLQNTTRTMIKIPNTSAHPTAMPITTTDPL